MMSEKGMERQKIDVSICVCRFFVVILRQIYFIWITSP